MQFHFAALAWAFLFALPNLYWATRSDFGSGTIAADPDSALGWGAEPLALLLTGAAKISTGVVAFAAGRTRFRLLVLFTLALGAGFLLYGVANFGQHALMLAGVVDIPESIGDHATRWHLLFWDPVWLLGGLLFLAAGWRTRVGSR